MPRLITFGCSYTFGEGLPDTHPLPKSLQDRIPSNYAWPTLLGKRLGYEVYNMSWGGSGNFEILLKVLKHKFYADDLVIIQWSHFTRIDFYDIIDMEANGKRIYEDGLTEAKHKLLISKMKLENKTWQSNNHLRNWLCITHANHFLRMNKIKNFFYLHTTGWEAQASPGFLDVKGHLDIKPNDFIVDKALDRAHPGTESHKVLADILYNKLKHELR